VDKLRGEEMKISTKTLKEDYRRLSADTERFEKEMGTVKLLQIMDDTFLTLFDRGAVLDISPPHAVMVNR
jgi:hypothetical protein